MTTSAATPARPLTLQPLATFSPPSTSRTWQSTPHPSLPLLATACADKAVRIYSLTSFTLLSTLTGGHRRSVRCCAWKPSPLDQQARAQQSQPKAGAEVDGKNRPRALPVLASGSFDATAAIWVGPAPVGEGGGFEYGGFDEAGGRQGDDDGEEDDYRYAVVLEGHDSEIKSLAWSVHGTFLATCSRDKSVWIWECLDTNPLSDAGGFGAFGAAAAEDEDNYETVAVLQEHDGDVKCVAWHPEDERCLASSSYDERVRIWREDSDGEWRCVGVCEGHDGTVWCVAWEPASEAAASTSTSTSNDRVDPSAMDIDDGDAAPELVSGLRLITCADDQTLRVWRRKPKPPLKQQSGPRMSNIIRSASDEEEWFEEGRLPQVHERAIYTVAWSQHSRRVMSAGSDGKIVIYEERTVEDGSTNGDVTVPNGHADGEGQAVKILSKEWVVLAELENAHGVFELNHVCWAKRWDRHKRSGDEEIVVSTGDDGEVRVWTLEGV